jgi:hypothetical protein
LVEVKFQKKNEKEGRLIYVISIKIVGSEGHDISEKSNKNAIKYF